MNWRNFYEADANFSELWKACKDPIVADRSMWLDYFIKDGMLLRSNELCIPRSSIRVNLIKEKHSGDLVGHFEIDKTLALVGEN